MLHVVQEKIKDLERKCTINECLQLQCEMKVYEDMTLGLLPNDCLKMKNPEKDMR